LRSEDSRAHGGPLAAVLRVTDPTELRPATRVLLENLDQIVTAPVVDDDHLVPGAVAGFEMLPHGAEIRRQPARLVVRRKNERKLDLLTGHGRPSSPKVSQFRLANPRWHAGNGYRRDPPRENPPPAAPAGAACEAQASLGIVLEVSDVSTDRGPTGLGRTDHESEFLR